MNNKLSYFIEKGNNNFDLLRLIAAIIVIYSHSFELAFSSGQSDVFTKLSRGLANGGGLAVEFFFLLSGILVTNSLISSDNLKKFIISRFFRIYPPFLFVLITTAVIISPFLSSLDITQYFSDGGVSQYLRHSAKLKIEYNLPGVFTGNIYKNAVNGSLWTIPFEVGAYFSLFSAYIITGGKKNIRYLSVVCLLIIILPILNIGDGLFFSKQNLSVSLALSCFALGALFAIHKENVPVSLAYPIAFLIISYLSTDDYLKHLTFFYFSSTLLLYIGTLNFIKKIRVPIDISYSVYLWGFFVQQVVYMYLPNLNIYVNQIICILLTIIISIPTFKFIEKPSMTLGKKLNRRFD